MARRPLERERVYLDGGRRTTQLMRDSLGRTMTYQALRAIHYIVGLLLLASSLAGAQGNCRQTPFPDTSSVDAIFLARLTATEPYTEMISIDDHRSSWPVVRLYLQPHYGWKIDPRTVTYPWFYGLKSGGFLRLTLRRPSSA